MEAVVGPIGVVRRLLMTGLWVMFCWQGGASFAQSGQHRIALLIGNSSYESTAPLRNPRNDAQLMARTLEDAGFAVTVLIDADYRTMKKGLLEFGRSLGGNDIEAGLFFYAGHGVQVGGENYLIPVDAKILSEDEVDLEAINVNSFLRTINSAESKINIVILDACRDNPFGRSFRSASRGLAPVDAPRGTLIAYATAPGDVALDGNGSNSPYTAALTESIANWKGQPVERIFKQARRTVLEVTQDRQVPWETSSVTGDFYFHPPTPPGEKTPGNQIRQPAPDLQGQAAKDRERKAKFQLAREMGSEAAWQAFLTEYGQDRDDFYVALARDALVALQTEAKNSAISRHLARPTAAGEICQPTVLGTQPVTLCVSSVLAPQSGNRYGGGNLGDRRMDTAWVEGVKGDGVGEFVTLVFPGPTALRQLMVVNGYNKNSAIFQKNGRVKEMVLRTSTGLERKVRLKDGRNWQSVDLSFAGEVTWLSLRISSVYPGSRYRDTAISELRLK